MADTMEGLGKEIPYDLRQVYAIEILGEHLKDIARARKTDNFTMYFKCLKDVFIVVQHKFKSKKTKYQIKNKDNQIEDKELTPKEYYNYLMGLVVKLANDNKEVWLGNSKEPKAYAAIEQSLNEVEMFLYNQIEEAKIFGSSRDIPGL